MVITGHFILHWNLLFIAYGNNATAVAGLQVGENKCCTAGMDLLFAPVLFSERELAICYLLSVVCLSVTFVHPTQAIEIFGNVSMPFNKLAIC